MPDRQVFESGAIFAAAGKLRTGNFLVLKVLERLG
jgi:hypothetical protein